MEKLEASPDAILRLIAARRRLRHLEGRPENGMGMAERF
jgi:hypothetical protein